MKTSTKVAICGALVTVFAFIGNISSGLCLGVPAPYQGICFAGGKAATEGANAIAKTMPDAGVP